MTINRYCEEYLAAGLALTEVSGKAPKKIKGWNRPENVIRRKDQIWASPEIPDTEIRCKDGLGGVGWVLAGCSLESSSSRQ